MDLTRDYLHQLASGLPNYISHDALNVSELDDYLAYYHLPNRQQFEYRVGQLEIDGQRIVCQAWSPQAPTATVVVVHGLYDHVGIFNKLVDYYLSRNQRVCCFDNMGHGLSSGEQAKVEDFEQYLRILNAVVSANKQLYSGAFNAVGQSMGGGILIHYILNNLQPSFEQVITLAPLVRALGWWWITRVHSLIAPFISKIPRGFSPSSHDRAFLSFLAQSDTLQSRYLSTAWVGAMKKAESKFKHYKPIDFPLVMIQGDDDDTVDWQFNIACLQGLFPGLQLHVVARARHQLVNESVLYRKSLYSVLDGYK
jgi:lysophospholipase